MDPSTVPKIRVKTKVESSVLQVPVGSFKGTFLVVVTSSTHGSLGSLNIIPQSLLGPSGCTQSKQKTVKESIKRERRARFHSFFFLFFFFFLTSPYSPLVYCFVVSPSYFFTDEWSFLSICSLSASQTLREQRVSPLVMMWYDNYSFSLSDFFLSLQLCIYIYIYIFFLAVLPIVSSCLSFFCSMRCLLL